MIAMGLAPSKLPQVGLQQVAGKAEESPDPSFWLSSLRPASNLALNRLAMFATVSLLLAGSSCSGHKPRLNCVPLRSTLFEGGSVHMHSNAEDPDEKDRLSYEWHAANGRLTALNGSTLFDSSGLSPGEYTVEVKVRDQKRHMAECQMRVEVKKRKLAPSLTCATADRNILQGETTTLEPRASDPNGDPLSFCRGPLQKRPGGAGSKPASDSVIISSRWSHFNPG